MNILSWNRCMWLSIFTLIALIVLNFYGIYTHKFYLLKPDNYIFLLLAIVHGIYLYVVQFKIREHEPPDPPMRNLEFGLYAILFVYIYKLIDAITILLSYKDYADHIIPKTFIPMGSLIITLYIMLIGLTMLSFKHRKSEVGLYNFEDYNDRIDSWEEL